MSNTVSCFFVVGFGLEHKDGKQMLLDTSQALFQFRLTENRSFSEILAREP